jgi:N-glycosylase/DNA lyase
VDTHVHKIAIKHYGLKGSLTSKATMTPKLYDEISTRLVAVWGNYAGWAHSVHIMHDHGKLRRLMRMQVLFTSDLKAFASHGIIGSQEAAKILPTPPPTPMPSPLKRKSRAPEAILDVSPSSALAERVKRRRRSDDDLLT